MIKFSLIPPLSNLLNFPLISPPLPNLYLHIIFFLIYLSKCGSESGEEDIKEKILCFKFSLKKVIKINVILI